MNHELQKIVIDSFDTGYTDESGLREIVTRGAGRLSEVQLVKEKNIMNQFMKEVLSTKGNLATYGQNPQVAAEIEMAIREKAGVISKKIEGNPLSPEKLKKSLVMLE